MTKSMREQFRVLLDRVFDRQISNTEFTECAAQILGTKVGEEYPKFVWKADHYLTDSDLCETDSEYEEMMRGDIMRLFNDYFAREPTK